MGFLLEEERSGAEVSFSAAERENVCSLLTSELSVLLHDTIVKRKLSPLTRCAL